MEKHKETGQFSSLKGPKTSLERKAVVTWCGMEAGRSDTERKQAAMLIGNRMSDSHIIPNKLQNV